MTLYELQDDLALKLKDIFQSYRIVNSSNKCTEVNVYTQNLPVKQNELKQQHFPFVMVSVEMINIEDRNTDEENHIYLLFGNYDTNTNKQGYKDIINMISKVKTFLLHEYMICGKYELGFPLKCVFQEEDTYPCFYGGMELKFNLPNIGSKQYIDDGFIDCDNIDIDENMEDMI